MFAFEIDDLIFPSLCIALATMLICFHVTKSVFFSSIASIIKSGFFFVYFGYFFDGTYTFKDDITYLNLGLLFLERGISFSNLSDEWEFIQSVGGGLHVGYPLFNAFAISIFGEFYFAPVAINIILSLFIALIGADIGEREFGLRGKFRYFFFTFLLFHPDIFAWSSMCNLKDIIVLLAHVVFINSISVFFRGEIKKSLIVALPMALLLITFRFYVPIIITLSTLITIVTSKRVKSKFIFLILGLLLISLVVVSIGTGILQYAVTEISSSITKPITGIFRAIMTPIPFRTEVSYQFLNWPALFHWLMIPVAVVGVLQIKNIKTPFIFFFFTYLAIFLILYGIYEELQGPRHRVQLDFAIALLQFVGILKISNAYKVSQK